MSLPEYMTPSRPSRPLGISILSVLHFLGGLGSGVFAVWLPIFASKTPEVGEALAAIGMPLPLIIIGIVFLGVLAIGSAFGMWKGFQWGWYLGSFYYAYSIIRNLSAILNVYLLADQLSPEELKRGPEYYYIKFGVRAIIHALIYIYFFKRNVLEYFGLNNMSALKVVLIEFALCIGIGIAVTIIGAMAQ